jgi:hypothetical protein
MKVSLFSDLHLKPWDNGYKLIRNSLQEQSPDVVINCGDYGMVYEPKIINEIDNVGIANSLHYVKVYGNHDYYQNWDHDPQFVDIKVKHIEDNWVIISHTMWTNYFNENPVEMLTTKRYLADFRYIRNWSPEKQVSIFNHFIRCLENHIKHLDADKKIMMVTHHAPSTLCINERFQGSRGNDLNGSFVNNLENLILSNPRIKYWFHGHVHDSVDVKIGECRILCHPKGYRGESNFSNYQPLLIEI